MVKLRMCRGLLMKSPRSPWKVIMKFVLAKGGSGTLDPFTFNILMLLSLSLVAQITIQNQCKHSLRSGF